MKKQAYFHLALAAFVTLMFLPALSHAGGFIVVNQNTAGQTPRNQWCLDLRSHKVDVDITDQAATTTVDQTFFNPTNARLEGHFILPLPEGSVITNFSMFIDGKEMRAELLDAQKAKSIYEDIVRQMRDPALLEYTNQSLFRCRIFPIEPRSEKRVKITYTTMIPRDNGTMEYQYQLSTDKVAPNVSGNLSLRVRLSSKEAFKNIYCPTHNTEIIRHTDFDATLGYEGQTSASEPDFHLYFSMDNDKPGVSLLPFKRNGEDGYFYMDISPGLNLKDEQVIDKDITFVLDVSGSMVGKKLEQAKSALSFCVENLNQGDCFEIVKFSTEASALFSGLESANANNRDKARDFIQDLRAIGGTNIQEALEMALEHEGKSGRPHIVIFITDGKPTIGETQEDGLLTRIKSANRKNTRIFTFGVGNNLNTRLLDKITEQTKAYRSYIAEDEDMEIKISNFFNKVSYPVLTDISIKYPSGFRVEKTYPRKLPDLFRGGSITISGRYQVAGQGEIMLKGKANGREFEWLYLVEFPETNSSYEFVPTIWASRRVGYLLDQIRLNGEQKEIVDEITDLARKHGIITPYTSYLILEDQLASGSGVPTRAPRVFEFEPMEEIQINDFQKKARESYSDMTTISGTGSVQSSMEVQQLNMAENISTKNIGMDRMSNTSSPQPAMSKVKNINGRAFYLNGNEWVDADFDDDFDKNEKEEEISFGSKEYYELLNSSDEARGYMSAGKNVRFKYNGRNYVVK